MFLPPPPLDEFEGEEMDLPIMEDVTLPPPVELLPEHMPPVQPLDIPIRRSLKVYYGNVLSLLLLL